MFTDILLHYFRLNSRRSLVEKGSAAMLDTSHFGFSIHLNTTNCPVAVFTSTFHQGDYCVHIVALQAQQREC